MSGLFALLDDVAALVKLAASSLDDIAAGAGRASVKAAGVVVDDAAVTPRYVQGLKPERELSIIWRIAKGSLRNKLLIILPVALLLSQFAPFLLTPILMVGGTYLCYEGAEKLWEKFSGHAPKAQETTRRPPRTRPAREAGGLGRHPHRLHPVRRDHGDRPERGGERAVRAPGRHPGGGRRGDHGAGLRRRRADRQDGRCRPGPGHAGRVAPCRPSGEAWSRPCPSCWAPCPGSAWWRCYGSAGTSCWSARTSWACMRRTMGAPRRGGRARCHRGLGAVLGWLTNTFFSAVLGLIVGAVVVAVLHVLPIGRKPAGHSGEADESADH